MTVTGKEEERQDWRDGFLFVGNRLALDLLNTKLVVDGETVEMLPDGAAFARWRLAAGVLYPKALANEPTADDVRAFRERLRDAVVSVEAGQSPKPLFVRETNALLSQYPARIVLTSEAGRFVGRTAFPTEDGGLFWGRIAASIAELLTEAEPHRIRKCESCVVHFYDSSKKGSRRWCSMNLCGNRLKVAAYQKRRRGEG